VPDASSHYGSDTGRSGSSNIEPYLEGFYSPGPCSTCGDLEALGLTILATTLRHLPGRFVQSVGAFVSLLAQPDDPIQITPGFRRVVRIDSA
jgi:hypothetical protein